MYCENYVLLCIVRTVYYSKENFCTVSPQTVFTQNVRGNVNGGHQLDRNATRACICKVYLAKIGYQPIYHVTYIVSDWFSATICLQQKHLLSN